MVVFLRSPVQVGLLILLVVCLWFFYRTASSEPVSMMFSRLRLSDLWESSLPFASFQHPSLVQRLKAIKRCWQTLDLLTHFLSYSLKLFTAAKNLHDWCKMLFLNSHIEKKTQPHNTNMNLYAFSQECLLVPKFLFYGLRHQNGYYWTQLVALGVCTFHI